MALFDPHPELDVAQLSREQLAFLEKQGVPLSRTFDATGSKKAEYRDRMKARDLWIAYGVSPCSAAQHTLRTRTGHCVQCDTAKLGFLRRNDEPAQVYVAHSARQNITKVGNAKDPVGRVPHLNSDGYGGVDDWRLVHQTPFARGGDAEFEVHFELTSYRIERRYFRGDDYVHCKELFCCKPEIAIQAVERVLARAKSEASKR